MARFVTCVCGEHHKVTKRNAGTRKRCEECKRMVEFPAKEDDLEEVDDDRRRRVRYRGDEDEEDDDRRSRRRRDDDDEDVEELEEVDDDVTAADLDEEERKRKYAGKPTRSKKKGICLLCEREGKGKFHTFFAGFVENVDRQHDYWSNTTTVRTTYRGIHKNGVFLCPDCQQQSWRTRYMLFAIGWAAPVVLFLFLSLFIAVANSGPGRLAALPMFIIAFIFAGIASIPLYWMFNPSYERETMEKIAIGLARRHTPEIGDSFWTVSEFRAAFGRHTGDT